MRGELRSEARAINAEQDALLCARPGGHPADVRCHSCPQEPRGAGRREPLGGAAPGLVWAQSAVLSDAAAAVGEGLPGGDRCRRRTSGRGLGIAASRVSGAGRMGPGLTMLRTAMVRTIAVVMTVSEICGHGRFAMTPEDFNSHRRAAEAFLLHCWGEGERKRHASSFCAFSRAS